MNNKYEERLGTERMLPLVFKMALPAVAAQFVNLLYSIVDRVYIGHIPGIGASALTGVGVCMPLILIVSAFAALVGYGGAPRASIYMGKKEQHTAEQILGNCFALQIIVSLILTAILLKWNRGLLLAFGASENTIGYASSYMNIYALGTFFVQLTLGMNAFITAQGFAKTGMLSVLIGAVANIVLDPIFIFGLDMGVRGAALATIIGQIVSGIMVIIYLTRFKTVHLTFDYLRPIPSHIKAIISLGMAPFFNQIAMMVVQIVMNNVLRYYGGQSHYGSEIPLACAGIISKVNMIFFSLVIGLSQGLQPIVSFNYGAGKYRRVRSAYLKAVCIATCISSVSFLCFQLIPRQIISIFGSGSEEYFRFAEQYFRIFLFFTFLNGLQPITANYFTSIGKAGTGIFISLTRQIIFLLPLILILPMFLGIEGVMYSAPVADLMAAVLAVFFVSRELKRMKQMEHLSET